MANLAFLNSFGEDEEQRETYIFLSNVANLNTIELAPKNILYWRTRGKNHYLYYQTTNDINYFVDALQSFEKVTEIAPTDAQSRYSLGLFYWIASQEVESSEQADRYERRAKEEITTALEMKPNYVEAKELLGEMEIL